MKLILYRDSDDGTQTLGRLKVWDNPTGAPEASLIFECKTLELTDRNNKRRVSCIPLGTYDLVKRNSPKFSNHFHVTDVPDRDYILIHAGNYHKDIEGCILVGMDHSDINGDGLRDVVQSRVAMNELNEILPKKVKLEIIKTFV